MSNPFISIPQKSGGCPTASLPTGRKVCFVTTFYRPQFIEGRYYQQSVINYLSAPTDSPVAVGAYATAITAPSPNATRSLIVSVFQPTRLFYSRRCNRNLTNPLTLFVEQRFYYSIGYLGVMEGRNAMREADLHKARSADLEELVQAEAEARAKLLSLSSPTHPDLPVKGVSGREWMDAANSHADAWNMLMVRVWEEGMNLRDEAEILRETLCERGLLWSGRLERHSMNRWRESA
jgi:hypothetical protein